MCWILELLKVPLVQTLILLGVVFALTVLSLIQLYNYITCGRCSSLRKMDGKTVLITGASGGIGKETARNLAQRGARVIMACRNLTLAKSVRDDIVTSTGNPNVVIMKLDLSSQKSIREFADEFNKNERKLHVLIHNAGTAERKISKTEDGLEKTMATNHFGPFLLTHLLIDVMKKSGPGRIVVVASELYRLASVNLDNINPLNSFGVYLYYVSKYANILFTHELARRLQEANITVNCLHPGMIDSGIWRNVPIPFNWCMGLITRIFFKTIEQGAQTTIHLAVSEELEGVTGKYFMDCKERGLSAGASDLSKAKKYWDLTEQLILKTGDPRI